MLWAETSRCCENQNPNDHGIVIGVYADRQAAREAAAEYRWDSRDDGLQIVCEAVKG